MGNFLCGEAECSDFPVKSLSVHKNVMGSAIDDLFNLISLNQIEYNFEKVKKILH